MDRLQATLADLKKAQEKCVKQVELIKVRVYGMFKSSWEVHIYKLGTWLECTISVVISSELLHC